MAPRIAAFSNWSYQNLENNLLPVRNKSITKTVALYAAHFFQFVCCLPLAITSSILASLEGRIFSQPNTDSPLVRFAKHPTWSKEPAPLPNSPYGFATADFHDTGPKRPDTNFGKLYLKDYPERFNKEDHFPDMRNHPKRYIDRLIETGAQTFRFSVSRDIIQPNEGSSLNKEELHNIAAFCKQLKEKNIEPIVTLEHFNKPLYQTFETKKGIQSFVEYTKIVAHTLYNAGVKKIVTFNEIGVEAFQGYIMGAFPPYHKADFEGAAKFFTGIMKTHNAVYDALKKAYPDFQIGFSHDPIRFRHYHKMHPIWSPIEQIFNKYLTDVNHTMVMNCLKTGKVELKVPLFANYSVKLKEKPKFDFIGLQYYTDPLTRIDLFTQDSVTRVPGEKTTAYRFRQYAQGLASAIDEISQFNKPIDLTELGIDTGINKNEDDKERIAYFEKILQVIQKALDEGKNIRSYEFWTLIDNFDWHQGWDLPKHCPIRFGFYKFDPKTSQITPRPVIKWLKQKNENQKKFQEIQSV